MTDFQILDEKTGVAAKVSPRGELITAPLEYSEAYSITVDAANQEFEVVKGIANKRFVITGMLITSSKTFGSALDAETILLYEANPSDLSVNLKTLMNMDMLKNDRMIATGLNLLIGDTSSIVAIATDIDVSVTLAGYFINCICT